VYWPFELEKTTGLLIAGGVAALGCLQTLVKASRRPDSVNTAESPPG
jgi:hypothetical protein